jgi:SAM-dependent methyltransferase
MRNALKKILMKLGLIERARFIYNSIKSFSVAIFKEELAYKKNNLPDGYPAPPKEYIFLIIGLRWVAVYYNSGKQIFEEMKTMFEKSGIDINSFDRVLDFGCGCGRIIRHFNNDLKSARLYGADYNPVLINWCKDNLTFGSFDTNKLAPPLDYEDGFFSLIYARSVFTHLSRELQIEWMSEFRRIIKKGGCLYFTTHGENTFVNLTREEREKLKKNGIITINTDIEGDNKCATYQTRLFVEKELTKGFEIVNFSVGQSNSSSPQDIYILKRI